MSLQRRIAWSWLAQAQATRNSLAPFLYQTPTLAFIRSHSSYPTSDTPESPSAEPPTQAENDNSTASHSIDPPTEPSPAPRKSFLRKRAAYVAKPTRILDPWTPRQPEKKAPEKRGYEKANTKTSRKPRLTTHETQTLAGLFSQLEPKKQEGLVQGSKKSELDQTEKDEMTEISAFFDSILRDAQKQKERSAVREGEGRPFNAPSQEGASASTSTVNSQVDAPNAVARNQEGVFFLPDTDEELAELLNTNQMTLAEAIDLVIKRETAKIKSVLDEAIEKMQHKGFWKLCQKEVFSMARLLDINKETKSVLDGSKPPSDGDNPQDAQRTPSRTTDGSPLKVPACIPIEAVVVGVYPRVLRIAFALLNLHYPESRLIGQFRTEILSLGRESATLGLSTSLYNDMLYFHWRVTHDFPQVVDISREMELTGASPDLGTINVLEGIARERNQDLKKRRMGIASAQPWWDLPPNRKAMRELLGEDGEEGLISRFKRQYHEAKEKKRIGKPYI
ncbi:hypothetical protein BJX76DRAFT_364544 [Aspergillus varians]